jgi:DNA-damage-inducible protein D
MTENNITIFEDHKIRRTYDKKSDTWFFSVVDVVRALADSANPNDYIKKMRKRDIELSKGWGQIVTPLAISTKGGMQKINCANTESLFRIIQSVSSPKAEPFKQWLAKVGYERIQEIADPEKSINRARDNWKKHGRSEDWIQRRMSGQETREKLTDCWKDHDIKEGQEYATLTSIIHQEWSGVSINND